MKEKYLYEVSLGSQFYHNGNKCKVFKCNKYAVFKQDILCYCYKTRERFMLPYDTLVTVESYDFPSTGPED